MFQQSKSIKKYQQLKGQSYHQLRQLGYSQLQSEVISGELYNQKFQDHLLQLMNFNTDTLNELVIRLALENIFELRQLVAISDIQIHSTEFFTYVNSQTFQDLKKSKQIMEELKNENPLPIFNFRERPIQIDQKQKIILFIGQTGVGKSSTINQIANYWILEDDDADFRVQLIPKSDLEKSIHSHTKVIKEYQLQSRKQYHDPIILIDTPGFKDTDGFQKDEEISKQLQALLQTKINQLDMICFIFKETESRLDDGINYIFTRIMEMFGKDIAPCIQIILTFSDRKANLGKMAKIIKESQQFENILPQILEPQFIQLSLDGQTIFTKDNDYKDEREFNKKSLQILVKKLKMMQPQGLLLTQEVIKNRLELQHKIEQFQFGMKDNLNSMSELQQYYQKNEKIRKIQQVSIPIDDGTYVTNCLTCQETCHFPCQIKQDDFKSQCWAMRNENCTKCPNKCNWKFHKNNNFRFDMQQKEIINNQQKDQKQIVDEYQQKVVDCIQKSVEILDSLQTLNQNALLPQSHKYVRDYYDFLINHEEKQKKEGFIERKNQLQIMKDKLDLLESKVQRKQINQELAWPLMELVDDNLLRSTILKLNQQYQQDYQQVI